MIRITYHISKPKTIATKVILEIMDKDQPQNEVWSPHEFAETVAETSFKYKPEEYSYELEYIAELQVEPPTNLYNEHDI